MRLTGDIETPKVGNLLAITLIVAVGLYAFRWVYGDATTFYQDDWSWLRRAVFVGWEQFNTIWTVLPAALFADRPVEMFAWKLLYETFGLNHAPYAVVSLAVHIANAVLLYVLAMKLVGSRFYALIAAILFVINGSVAAPAWWMSLIADSASLFFCLCAFLSFLSPNRIWAAVGSVVFYWLAFKSKEVSLAFPWLLFAYAFLSNVRSAALRDIGTALRLALKSTWPVLCVFALFLGFALHYYMQAMSQEAMVGYGPYKPRFDLATLGDGIRIYLQFIAFQLATPNQAATGFIILTLVSLATFNRVAIIGAIGFFIGLGSVLFLANQRIQYYAYPSCAYVALMIVALAERGNAWLAARLGTTSDLVVKAAILVALVPFTRHVYMVDPGREWVLGRMQDISGQWEAVLATAPPLRENGNTVVIGAQGGPNLFGPGACDALSVIMKVWTNECRTQGTEAELLAQYEQFAPPKMLLRYEAGKLSVVTTSP